MNDRDWALRGVHTAIGVLLVGALGAGCAAEGGARGDGRVQLAGGGGSNAGWSAGVSSRRWGGDARALAVFRGDDGARVGWGELVEAAAAADVVIVGELHGHAAGQAFQMALWEDLLAAAPGAVASLEFFERDHQTALDDYVMGVTGRDAFMRAAQRRGGNYPIGHRAIVESSREQGRPVIAANAPRRYVRLARVEGFARLRGLTAEQRRMFVIPERMPEGRYREDFFAAMRHSKGEGGEQGEMTQAERERAESFLRSQSVWDWTMADAVARGLSDGHRPVVHIVGRFHSDFDGGLVQALEWMRPGARVVTVSCVAEWGEGLGEGDVGRGGFVVYIGDGE